MTAGGDVFSLLAVIFFTFRPEKTFLKALRKIGGKILTLIPGGATDDDFHKEWHRSMYARR